VPSRVELYWIPLGAGDNTRCVRWSGHAFEALAARRQHRHVAALYHSALRVVCDGTFSVIEMGPAWGNTEDERGVVSCGPVGLPMLGRSSLFRYEVRCWKGGSIPDVSFAIDSPQVMSDDAERACLVLGSVSTVPPLTWGRDEGGTGSMWNSNALISWLLAATGHDLRDVLPPAGGRAPGWECGRVLARRGVVTATRS
jgi:hypothetical protein